MSRATLNLPSPKLAPIAFHAAHSPSAPGERPAPDFAVSRRADGRVVSRYRDLIWDWTPYEPSGRRRILNFQFWPRDREPTNPELELLEEIRWVAFRLAYKRNGPSLSGQSMLHYVKALRALARHCAQQSCGLADTLSNHELLIDAVNELPAGQARQLAAVVSALSQLGVSEVGFSPVGLRTAQVLRGLAREYGSTLNQHPPLPTRVYSHIITALTNELHDFEQVADRYFALVERCAANPLLGRSRSIQWKSALALGIDRVGYEVEFRALSEEHGVRGYLASKRLGSSSNACSVITLSSELLRVQAVCRLLIQLFSGMREEEVAQLPLDCLQSTSQAGKSHYFLVGVTTKLNNAKAKAARWVTSREGARAVAVAQRIARTCAQAAGGAKVIPLFPAMAYLGLAGKIAAPEAGRLLTSKFDFSKYQGLRTALQPLITEDDLRELERIDPHRAWRSEEAFQIGRPWTLTSHQLRRSLALYAQRSGLVSLPSLRRQLQHLTEEMSRYYARGSAFADSLIAGDKDHFGAEWRDAQPVSAALSYIFNVLTTDETLFGAHGNWVEHRLRGEDGTVLVDRDETIRRFKRGELAYRETILGGCTSTERCELQPIKWLNVDCVKGCKNMVGRASKLDRVIAAQTRMTEGLPKDSFEHQTEATNLQILLDARARVQQRISDSPRTS